MLRKIISSAVVVCFFVSCLSITPAQAQPLLGLPEPGTMVNLSPAYQPAILKGVTVHKDNPFLFDFIVNVGQDRLQGEALKQEGEKLVKYFLATLAIPEKDIWVNLSPYEKDRTIPAALGQTDMGRDLLAQDYLLKQMTASLIYPENGLGKKFWDNVYSKAQQQFGSSEIPVNTFNKVWIMADQADIFERNQTAFVVASHLKVMLEEDYLAVEKNGCRPGDTFSERCSQAGGQANKPLNARATEGTNRSTVTQQIIRDVVLPELEREVNTGKNFAQLRQIFNSIILAAWYKKNLKQSLLNEAYSDKKNVKGIDIQDRTIKEQIYQRYLQAYKKGVFNYIKEENTPQGAAPRKYFSGGVSVDTAMMRSISLQEMQAGTGTSSGIDSEGMAQISVALAEKIDQRPDRAELAAAADVDLSKFEVVRGWKTQTRKFVGEGKLINPEVQRLMAFLTAKYASQIKGILAAREAKQEAVDRGEDTFGFLTADTVVPDAYGETKTAGQIRSEDWKVAPVPADLAKPGAILTGPWATAGWAINALRSGAVRLFWDREDAGWDKGVSGLEAEQVAMDIITGKTKEYFDQDKQKLYTVPERSEWPVVTNRVRGLHFDSKFFAYDNIRAPGMIEDLVTYVVNTYKSTRPYIVMPKLQDANEVRLAVQVVADLEKALGLEEGTIRLILMVETIELTLQLEEALWAGRKHIAITNVGRWDKMATDIRIRRANVNEIMPDPNSVGMTSPHMKAYVRRTTDITLNRGAEIEGGMFAFMKSRNAQYPETDAKVTEMVLADKRMEREEYGMKFAWGATPQVVPEINSIFQSGNYSNRVPQPYGYSEDDAKALLQLPPGHPTKEGFRRSIYDGLAYAIGQRTAGGAVAIIVEDPNMPGARVMQDYAIDKINYYWDWTLVHHRYQFEDGTVVTPDYVAQVLDEQIQHIKDMPEADKFPDADWNVIRKIQYQLITAPRMLPHESLVMNSVIDLTDPKKIDVALRKAFADAAMTVDEIESEIETTKRRILEIGGQSAEQGIKSADHPHFGELQTRLNELERQLQIRTGVDAAMTTRAIRGLAFAAGMALATVAFGQEVNVNFNETDLKAGVPNELANQRSILTYQLSEFKNEVRVGGLIQAIKDIGITEAKINFAGKTYTLQESDATVLSESIPRTTVTVETKGWVNGIDLIGALGKFFGEWVPSSDSAMNAQNIRERFDALEQQVADSIPAREKLEEQRADFEAVVAESEEGLWPLMIKRWLAPVGLALALASTTPAGAQDVSGSGLRPDQPWQFTPLNREQTPDAAFRRALRSMGALQTQDFTLLKPITVGRLLDVARQQSMMDVEIISSSGKVYTIYVRADGDKVLIPAGAKITVRTSSGKIATYIRALGQLPKQGDPAMPSYGGIDLNTAGINWRVDKDGKGVEMKVDPAMIERVRREGIQSLRPVIFRVAPITNIWPMFGMEPPAPSSERLASV